VARTFYLGEDVSDLSLGGAFTHDLEDASGVANTDPVTATNSNGTNQGYYVTPSGNEINNGASPAGTYTVEIDVTVAASGVNGRCKLQRRTSTGTLGSETAFTADQSMGTTGVKTFTFTDLALGTWATTDRLCVVFEVQNTNSHGGAAGPTYDTLTTDAEVATAFAAPATNLVIEDATHSHSADSLALTQVHALAVADAVHSHAADNVALVVNLNVADAAHGHTADNVTLTEVAGGTDLVVQDGAHVHTADGVALVVELAVADATHAHSADNLTVTSDVGLVIQDAAHGHTADSLGLTHIAHIFEPPTANDVPTIILRDPTDNVRPWKHFAPHARSRHVYKSGGSYTTTDREPTQAEIDSYQKFFHGGHRHVVTQSEKTELEAAGYTVTEEVLA